MGEYPIIDELGHVILILILGCLCNAAPKPYHEQNIMESLYYNGFQKMAEFLLNYDLVRQTLDLNSTIILAPSNEVLENSKTLLDSKSKGEIQEILQRHIFPHLERFEFLKNSDDMKKYNLNDEQVEFSVSSESQITCSIKLDHKKIEATIGEKVTVPKGIIYKINKLLM